MVREMKKSEIERRRLLERILSVVLSGVLAMSVCSTTMFAFATDAMGSPCEGVRSEEAVGGLSVAFMAGDASIDVDGVCITGQQALLVAAGKDLVFTVVPRQGHAVAEVSSQLLSEGVLDVLAPMKVSGGAQYTVAADRLADGMAIVVDTIAVEADGSADPEASALEDIPTLFPLSEGEIAAMEAAMAASDARAGSVPSYEIIYRPDVADDLRGDATPDAQREGLTGTYAVKHYLQNTDGTYTCAKSDSFEGKVGDEVQAQAEEYPLHALNEDASTLTGTIVGGGSSDDQLVLNLFYDHTALTVTGHESSANVKDVEKIYDGQPVSVEASTDKNGSTLLYYTDGMKGWSTDNPRFTDAGTYAVLVKAIDPSDSEANVVTAHVTVKPAPAVIKVRDAEKTFGSSDPAFDGVIEGLIPGDEIGSVVYYRLNGGVEDVGSYAGVLSALVQHRNGNYAYTVTPGSFTIKGSSDATARNPVNDQMGSGSPSDPNLVTDFAQSEGMQRFAEDVVEPIATLVGVANADPAIIAALLGVSKADRATIADDDTPLAAFGGDDQEGRWLPLLIIFGAFVTAVVGGVAVLRRLRQTWRMDDDLDEVCSPVPNFDDEDALPALDALRTW